MAALQGELQPFQGTAAAAWFARSESDVPVPRRASRPGDLLEGPAAHPAGGCQRDSQRSCRREALHLVSAGTQMDLGATCCLLCMTIKCSVQRRAYTVLL